MMDSMKERVSISTVSPRGQVTIPKSIRDDQHIETGDKVIIRGVNNYVIMKKLDEGAVEKFFKSVK